ncbi:MAG TPA: alpha/beta fold hydrolase [Streptosporangiaceae bacterium]|nr:alpha/beta fold hydrolase [Streptosporangiaceae bacterium]
MYFSGRDGARLAYQETGEGRPLILLHGLMERGSHWVDLGLAWRLADRGHRVIMPDLRGHGDSTKSRDARSYPPDVLAHDGLALVDHLGLADYDLAGHSVGGRTVARMLVHGATPRRAVITGQGLEAVLRPAEHTRWERNFLSACGAGGFEPGSKEQNTEDWLRAMNCDPQALLLLLDSWVNTTPAELGTIAVPVLVLTGDDEPHTETATALADAFPHARHAELPGDHFTVKMSPEFEDALAGFLAD